MTLFGELYFFFLGFLLRFHLLLLKLAKSVIAETSIIIAHFENKHNPGEEV